VAEARELLLRGLDDPRVRVADVQAADAAGQVDEGVAVDVGEQRAATLGDDDRVHERQRLGDDLLLARDDLLRARAGDRRADLDRARDCHRR
jgi:hypothetical protein